MTTWQGNNMETVVINGTYVSGDTNERAEAFLLGYKAVCQHPNEIGVLEPDECLVIDGDRVLFGDKAQAAAKAAEAAKRGVTVGIHSFLRSDWGLGSFPNVVLGRTHAEVLALIQTTPAPDLDSETTVVPQLAPMENLYVDPDTHECDGDIPAHGIATGGS